MQHAHARNIAVHLRQDGAAVILEIEDDGVGLDVCLPPTTGFGLPTMRRRAPLPPPTG